MRQFRIEPEVFSILPHLEIGAVALRGIDNRAGGGDSAAVLQAACARLRERLTAHGGELPEIQDYVEAMKLFRRKKGCRASLDAMARRIARGEDIGSINPAVDLYNSISLQYRFTCGGENLEQIRGDMVLGFAKGTEFFVPLGEQEESPPREGELVYRDDAGIVVRSWVWRESDRTKVDEDTRDVLLYMENINPGRHEEFLQALDALYDLALRLGGAGEKQIISASRPACPL